MLFEINGWQIAGQLFGLDSGSRRKLLQETLKRRFVMIWGFLEMSLKRRIPPKWSLESPVASQLILGGSWFRPK
jgi:hypothetical protein